jgi:hypothetical protein
MRQSRRFDYGRSIRPAGDYEWDNDRVFNQPEAGECNMIRRPEDEALVPGKF